MYKAFIEPDLKVGGCGVAVACRWLAHVRPPGQRDSQLCGGCPGLFTHARMNRTASQPLLLLLQGAHLRVYNTFNPFSGFMSPTYILKSAKPVAKGEVAKVLKVRTAVLQSRVHFNFELHCAAPVAQLCRLRSLEPGGVGARGCVIQPQHGTASRRQCSLPLPIAALPSHRAAGLHGEAARQRDVRHLPGEGCCGWGWRGCCARGGGVDQLPARPHLLPPALHTEA